MSLQVRLGKLSHRNMSLWTSVFFCGWASNSQVSPKASPRAIFKWKNLIEPLKLLSNELQLEKAECQHAPICAYMCHYVPAWANIAVCQLCRERIPWWNSHDGLNLTCFDQCHGVRSHGKSSSQGWRKRSVVQSKSGPPISPRLPRKTRMSFDPGPSSQANLCHVWI